MNQSEKWINHFDRNVKIFTYFHAYYDMLIKITKLTQGNRVLEIGAGSGLSSIALKDYGLNITSLDISPDVIQHILINQRSFRMFFPLICCDMFHLPFRANMFNMVYSQGVLEHFDENDVIKSLREQARVGQRVLIDVPSDKAKGSEDAFGDERYWNWRKWQGLIQQSNLKVLRKYGWGVRGFYKLLMLLLPNGFFRLFSYMLTSNIGFVCEKINNN